ncbi:MAG TPA: hypothetical protein VK981_09210 [Ramlibacter sp.]|nr:hypothetical protein [Ramlibacter sp.]
MVTLRMFLTCLLLVALPLQGLAAASMLHCAPAAGDRTVEPAVHVHEGGADHAVHAHPGHDQPAGSGEPADAQQPAAGHACGACAACGHSVAISQSPLSTAACLVPQVISSAPLLPVHDLPGRVPDKPPRA